MINLKKDERINLSKDINADKIQVGLGWTGIKEEVDLDSYVSVFDSNGNRISFVYFGNLKAQGIKHFGDDLVGGGKATDPNEAISITLSALPNNAHKVVIGAVDYGKKGLYRVKNSFLNISQDNKEVLRADLGEYPNSMGVVAGLFQKRGSEWYFINKSISSSKTFGQIRSAETLNSLLEEGTIASRSQSRTSLNSSSTPPTPSEPQESRGFFSRLFG